MTLSTVKQFAEKHPCFPKGGLRYYLFHRDTNGLAKSGAIKQVGRKLFIVESAFLDWIYNSNSEAPHHGK